MVHLNSEMLFEPRPSYFFLKSERQLKQQSHQVLQNAVKQATPQTYLKGEAAHTEPPRIYL